MPVQNYLQMSASHKQSSQIRPESEGQSANAQPDPGRPATFGQKIFMAVLFLYLLSLVWLTLSHHWYGVLPKWLDPH